MGAVIWQKGKAREARSQDDARGSMKRSVGWEEGAGEELALLSAGGPPWVFTPRGILSIILCISHSGISTIKKNCQWTPSNKRASLLQRTILFVFYLLPPL